VLVVVGLAAACGRLGFELESTRANDGAIGPSQDGATDSDAALSTACTGFICDDFEGSALDARWDISTSMGSGQLDTTRAHSGTQSVHLWTDAIATSASDVYALLHAEMGLPFTGRVYSRAWVYLQSPQPTTMIDQIIDFSTLGGLGMAAGTRDGMFVNNDYTSMMFAESQTATVQLDTWFCLQFQMPTGTSGDSMISIGDSVVADLTLSKTTTQPAPDQVYIGTEWPGTVSAQARFDAWIDDVIVSTSATTCEQQ
jgi:hypothetical protein